jgi:CheY-like chemotaxis protein
MLNSIIWVAATIAMFAVDGGPVPFVVAIVIATAFAIVRDGKRKTELERLVNLLRTDHDVEVSVEPRAIAERLLAGERFDVILCDLMMPGMTGMELHATVAKRVPEQADRFVFVTGGAFTPAATDFVGRVSNTVLTKPYDLRALNAALAVHLRR